jgi:type IV pilus assembly protein PilX
MKIHRHSHRIRSQAHTRQRGVVLLFSLIAMVIMLIASVALVRSFQGTLFNAGNIAFKRDLQNQSERAIQAALTQFQTGGGLATVANRSTKKINLNYSATMLPTNTQGIPDIFGSDNDFKAVGTAADIKVANMEVSIRYVIDRLCSIEGDEKAVATASCVLADDSVPAGSSASKIIRASDSAGGNQGAAPKAVVYRLTARVSGPRNTLSFFQSTFTVPS